PRTRDFAVIPFILRLCCIHKFCRQLQQLACGHVTAESLTELCEHTADFKSSTLHGALSELSVRRQALRLRPRPYFETRPTPLQRHSRPSSPLRKRRRRSVRDRGPCAPQRWSRHS